MADRRNRIRERNTLVPASHRQLCQLIIVIIVKLPSLFRARRLSSLLYDALYALHAYYTVRVFHLLFHADAMQRRVWDQADPIRRIIIHRQLNECNFCGRGRKRKRKMRSNLVRIKRALQFTRQLAIAVSLPLHAIPLLSLAARESRER